MSEPAPAAAPPKPARRVLMTPFIMGMNVSVFIAMVARGVSPVAPKAEQLIEYGANFGAQLVLQNEWWRAFTSMFVHIGALHLAVNMFSLWSVGSFVERLVGGPKVLVMYLLTGLAGSFAMVMWDPTGVSAGASGAIFGLFGVVIGFTFAAHARLPQAAFESLRASIVVSLAFNLLFALVTPHLGHAAHLGGLLTGVLAGVTATWSAFERKEQRATWTSQAIVLATVAALAVLAATRTRSNKQLQAQVTMTRAVIAGESNDWEGVVKHATEALALKDDVEARWLRGEAQLRLGHYDETIEDLKRVNRPEARNSYAWALVRQNRDLDEALQAANVAVKSAPEAAFLGTRCWVYVLKNELDRARADCEAAVKAGPVNLLDLGMLRYLAGDRAGALIIWQQAAAQSEINSRDLEPWLERAKRPAAGSEAQR